MGLNWEANETLPGRRRRSEIYLFFLLHVIHPHPPDVPSRPRKSCPKPESVAALFQASPYILSSARVTSWWANRDRSGDRLPSRSGMPTRLSSPTIGGTRPWFPGQGMKTEWKQGKKKRTDRNAYREFHKYSII